MNEDLSAQPDKESIALGVTETRISRLGFGCWATGGFGWGAVEDKESIAAIRTAFEHGINHFDTADVYGLGHSEKVLSEALGAQRHEAVIATKFGVRILPDKTSIKDLSTKHCREAVEGSLKRLRVDSIPLYYAHWPDPKTPMEQLMETLLTLRQEGKIQAIGLSNFSAAQIEAAAKIGPVSAVQIECSLICREHLLAIREITTAQQITVVSWGSLARGLLTGKFNETTVFPPDDSRSRDVHFQGERFRHNLSYAARVLTVAQKRNQPPAAVALRYVLDTQGIGCALFGAKSSAQVLDNLGTAGWRLSQDELIYLEQV